MLCQNYFSILAVPSNAIQQDNDYILDAISSQIFVDMDANLSKPFTSVNTRSTLFQMDRNNFTLSMSQASYVDKIVSKYNI